MRRSKRFTVLAIYGAMVLLALLGFLMDSEMFFVAIIGLCTAALAELYEPIHAAAKGAISDRAKSIQFRLIVLLLATSVGCCATAYFAFGDIGWSGFMLGLAAACMRSLVDRDTW
ncbi:hypothetical protein [Pseudoduganella armeniaca]|uniref:Uncharacterized protein n=1 Tax=Pseudoduganella armeniaca TaxID=2072590 RepID=A0A2R4CDQ6_9BURK|nr:hypothetical protein [Pseudoduganella armeniaca]AVR97784.1 hypothetical protein C9I28_20710 [Pseudoduganella armeniaca]